MFGKDNENNYMRDENNQAEDTIIGSTIKIEGDLVSNGDIVVEGEVVGTLKTDRALRIGEKAKVKADVKAAEAFVAGEVIGNIEVDGKLDLTETEVIEGNIKAKVLSIQSGARFNGGCSMDVGPQVVEKAFSQEADEQTIEADEAE